MNHTSTKKLVLSALFATLTCVCTMAITIPTPTGGYIHAGDCFVLLSGIFLGPVTGGLAGGIGSMLSDLMKGYMAYVPATFAIKFLAAFFAGAIYHKMYHHKHSLQFREFVLILCGLCTTFIVILGYFLFEWLLTNNAFTAALSGIMMNFIQGVASIVLSCIIYPFLLKMLQSTIANS